MRLIRILRAVFAIRQRDLAAHAGISVRELARLEASEVVPTQSTANAIDAAFMCIVKERVKDDDEHELPTA